MRTLVILLIALILIGGGYYWYSNQAATDINVNVQPQEEIITTTEPQNQNPTTTQPNATTSTASPSAAVKEITVTSTGMAFNPKTLSVKKGDRVKVTYTNGGGTHDLRIDGYNVGTKVISGGQSETFEFVADKAGTFEYYCSVGNHRQMGMKGTLTVTE